MADKDGKKCTKPTEIHGFAIPTSRSSVQKRTTEIELFSSDTRYQLILKRNMKLLRRTWNRKSGSSVSD
jgi:hypothetical protein